MSSPALDLAERLRARFAADLLECQVELGQVQIDVAAPSLLDIAAALKNEQDFAFHQLVDLCAVDYLDFGKADWETSEVTTASGYSRGVERQIHDEQAEVADGRFSVVYLLLSHEHNQRLRMRTTLSGDPPMVASVVDIWPAADWYEREAFDLFGVLFSGHPDLRRLLTDYGFIGHPFRKDFPLIGEVEMRYDPSKGRVVYEPVTIEARTLVPKVIRHDARSGGDDSDDEAA